MSSPRVDRGPIADTMPESDLHAWEFLRKALGDTSPVLPFANGVALHLSSSGALEAEGDELLLQTLQFLRAATGEGEPPSPELLAGNPVLFASFFQNTDLLPPTSPATLRLLSLLAGALEVVGWDSE